MDCYDQQSATECGLLTSIRDPLGHTVSYQYGISHSYNGGASIALLIPNSVWVMQITEPGGASPHSWLLADVRFWSGNWAYLTLLIRTSQWLCHVGCGCNRSHEKCCRFKTVGQVKMLN